MVEHGLKNCSDNAKAEFQRLVETQAILLSVVLAAGNRKNSARAYRILSAMWKSVTDSEELYGNAISSSDQSTQIVTFCYYFIAYFTETKKIELIRKYKVRNGTF